MSNVVSIKTGEIVVESRPYIKQAYTTTNGAKCTSRYTHIQTAPIYEAIEALGFRQAASSTSKRAKEHSRHVTIFERDDILFEGCKPRLIVDNSHDGTRALKIHFGLYRTFCANGLVVGTDLIKPLRVLHKGELPNIERRIEEFVAKAVADTVAMYAKMANVELSIAQEIEFSDKAFKLRYGDDSEVVNWHALRKTRRMEDSGSSLWAVYNRVQEALMEGAKKRSRRITSTRKALDFNNELSNLALQYAA